MNLGLTEQAKFVVRDDQQEWKLLDKAIKALASREVLIYDGKASSTEILKNHIYHRISNKIPTPQSKKNKFLPK